MISSPHRDAWLRGAVGLCAVALVTWLDDRPSFALPLTVAIVATLITVTEVSLRSRSRPLGVMLVTLASVGGALAVTLLGPDSNAWLLLLPMTLSVTNRFGQWMTIAAATPILITVVAMVAGGHGAPQAVTAAVALGAIAAAPWASAAVLQRESGLASLADQRGVQVEKLRVHSQALQDELRDGSDVIRRTRRDLTARIERAEARHSSILRAVAEGVITIDSHGEVTTANPAAAALFGLDTAEVVGRPLSDMIPSFDIARVLGELGSAGRFGEPLLIEARRGTLLWDAELVFGSLDPSDEWSALTVLIRDVSERARIERMKDELIATISHELRTPLTGVLGALGLLTSRLTDDPKSTQLAALAHRNARRLNRLVEDILDVQRIEAGRLTTHMESVPVSVVLDLALEQAALRGAGRDVALSVEPPPAGCPDVRADAERLAQALSHLIVNAEKFSPQGAPVTVRAVPSGDTVRLEVIDAGPGLTDTQVLRVFRKFEVANGSDTRSPGGAGVGLTIARAVAVAHGSDLGVESQPGTGAMFYLSVEAVRP